MKQVSCLEADAVQQSAITAACGVGQPDGSAVDNAIQSVSSPFNLQPLLHSLQPLLWQAALKSRS